MVMSKEDRRKTVEEFGLNAKDSGSSEVQVALYTRRIQDLQEHFKKHPKDFHSRRGLLEIVGKRRKLLDYIKKTKPDTYLALIKRLKLRK